MSIGVEINAEFFTLAVPLLANMEARRLTIRIGDLVHLEDQIRRALERVFTGF